MAAFDLSTLPRWVFAFAALIIAVSAGYGMFYAECTTQLFGMSFGKNRSCTEPNAELVGRVQDFEQVKDYLVSEIGSLGTRDRDSVARTVTNQSGGDKAGCPDGYFVSSITAPGGVGGKYATDGINKITYRCSPLKKQSN